MNKREINKRLREIKDHFEQMAEILEKEKRAMTPEEQSEETALKGEMHALRVRLDALEANVPADEAKENRSKLFANCVKYMKRGMSGDALPEEYRSVIAENGLLIPMTREVQDNASVANIVPLTIGEIIEPLEKGLILDKVGCKVQTGMVGAWQFPVVAGGVEAELQDENVELTDKTIDISKIAPTPRRVGISIPVSNRAIDQSGGVILDIVRKQLSMALQRLLNKWMFNKTQVSKASDGCFVKAYAEPAVTCAGATPTWAEVLQIEAKVLGAGIIPDGTAAWVCTSSMYAALKAAPKDAGSGRFIVEDGMIDGYPVFITEYVEKDMLGFGVFSYELVGQFGEMRMTVDSTSAAVAKKNLTYFVFNTDFDMLTLREEAFAVGKTTPGA